MCASGKIQIHNGKANQFGIGESHNNSYYSAAVKKHKKWVKIMISPPKNYFG